MKKSNLIYLFILFHILCGSIVVAMDPTLAGKKTSTKPVSLYGYFGLSSRFGDSALKEIRAVLTKELMQGKEWWYTKHTVCDERSSAHTVAYSGDGAVLATASRDNAVHLWDRHGKAIATKQYPCGIVDMVCSSREPFLVVALKNETLEKVDFKGESVKTVRLGSKQKMIAITADGLQLCTVCDNGVVKLWPLSGGKPSVLSTKMPQIKRIAFYPEKKQFIAVGDKKVCMLDFEHDTVASSEIDGLEADVLAVSSTRPLRALVVDEHGNLELSKDYQLYVYDEQANSSHRVGNQYDEKKLRKQCIKALAFDRTGSIIAAACHQDYTYVNVTKGEAVGFNEPDCITIWDAVRRRELATLFQDGLVKNIVFHPRIHQLAVACDNKPASVWQCHANPTFEQMLLRLVLKSHLARCIMERVKPKNPTCKQQSTDDEFMRWMAHVFNLKLISIQAIWRTLPDIMRASIIKTYVHRADQILRLKALVEKNQKGRQKQVQCKNNLSEWQWHTSED